MGNGTNITEQSWPICWKGRVRSREHSGYNCGALGRDDTEPLKSERQLNII
jgi:hypothetical protein